MNNLINMLTCTESMLCGLIHDRLNFEHVVTINNIHGLSNNSRHSYLKEKSFIRLLTVIVGRIIITDAFLNQDPHLLARICEISSSQKACWMFLTCFYMSSFAVY